MGEQEQSHEYQPLSPYRRYYNDLYSKPDVVDQAIAMKNLTQDVSGYEIRDQDIMKVAGTADGQLDKAKLLMFPINVLGPFLEQTGSAEMYDNYLTAFQCVTWFTKEHFQARCNDLFRRDVPCPAKEPCVLKDIAKFCIDPITDVKFYEDIEYIDPTNRYDALSVRLSALSDSKLFGVGPVRELVSRYEWKFADFYGSLPQQPNPEDL